ncbi:MAG: hypothetical protein PHR70_07925 [Tissierellia bacterium]|nr:hypothetical protein [Tissierellia bacterium]
MLDLLMQYGEMFSIIMFFIPAIFSMLVLYFAKRNWIWVSIPITIIVDLLVWGKAIVELSHARVLLIFLIPQVTVVAIISLVIIFLENRRRRA